MVSVDSLKQPDRVVINRALALAEEVHHKHYRKPSKSDPYVKPKFIAHPMRVALILIEELGIKERDILVAALLHDVVEDSSWKITTHDLEKKFNRSIALMVSIVTRPAPDENIARELQLLTYHERIEQANVYARVIKLAERLDNLRDLKDMDEPDFQKTYLVETWQIYVPIAANTDKVLHEKLVKICRQMEEALTISLSTSE
jgi:(p)ppGpp synthase/HD superfamily hydrolase